MNSKLRTTHRAHRLLGAFAACALAGCVQSPPSLQSQAQPLSAAGVFATAKWGSGPDELGHALRDEAASEGPMSLNVGPDGRLYVLDQVNARVQVFSRDGAVVGSVPIGTETAQDLAVVGGGRIWLLDRHRGLLALVDADGRRLAEVGYLGHGVAEPAVTTALFAFGGSLGVEVERTLVVRVASLEGAPDADRRAFDGVPPARDGGAWRRATLAATDPHLALVWDAAQSGALSHRREVRFDLPVRALRGLASDAGGNAWLAVYLARERAEAPFDVVEERSEVAVIDGEGGLLARVAFAPMVRPEEQFREFAFAPDGAVYHLQCVEDGAVIARWSR